MTEKLVSVVTSLDRGATVAACNQLDAFINQVHAFVKAHKLSAEAGQNLIDAAEDIRAQIGC